MSSRKCGSRERRWKRIFFPLLQLSYENDPQLKIWLAKKTTFTSHEIQNEYIYLLSHHVMHNILNRIRLAKYFNIIGDEVTDKSRQHDLGISIRWVDEHFFVHENFLELYLLSKGDADTMTRVIKDTLIRCQLPLSNCWGQCHDGARLVSWLVTSQV